MTSWDDEESWRIAQERHNPRQLLSGSATELLIAAPQQWIMHYLWGYSRPVARAGVAAAHLAAIRPNQIEFAQQGCMQGLQQQDLNATLALAFLARGARDESNVASQIPDPSYQQGSMLLTLFSWANEEDREDFYADPYYRAIDNFISSLGTQHILPLEPM
jgi:hypothetical protein